LNLAKSQT